jgi:hypothetical protein
VGVRTGMRPRTLDGQLGVEFANEIQWAPPAKS